MSVFDDSLVDDTRALLAAFVHNDLRELTVELRSGVDLRFLRESPALRGLAVLAPHVANLKERLSGGQFVRAGATVAVLDLLGEAIELKADVDGIVTEGAAEIGNLVEFGEPLAWLEQSSD